MAHLQVILGLTCLVGCGKASEVQFDWDTLTDFSTKFSASMHTGFYNQGDSMSCRGELNLDVFRERLFVKFSGRESSLYGDGQEHGSFYFDAVQGHAVLKVQGTVDTPPAPRGPGSVTVYPSCVNVGVQKGLLPPPEMVKMQVEQLEPGISSFFNHFKHTDATVGGVSVALFSKGALSKDEELALKHDGTPVYYVEERYGFGNKQVNFTDWTHGAKIPDDASCTKVSAAELVATTHGKRALRQLDSLMAIIRFMKPLDMPFNHFPAKPSLLFEAAAGVERSAQRTEPGIATTTVAAAAGVLASLLVFALVAVLKPRRSNGTPLLAEAA